MPLVGIASGEDIVSEDAGQRKKLPKRDRLTPEQMAQAINAKKSYWPFALAVAVFIALIGVVTHPIVIGIGTLLAVVAIIGWGLEYH
jgi:hypothetical protein